jgi:glycosyltransferase involved in cell wall biosynthesis
MTRRVAIVSTHPVQYQACWYRAMASHPGLDPDVFFCHHATASDQAEAGFGVEFEWDTPLLEGYSFRFLHNVAKRPSPNTFRGTDTPEIQKTLKEGHYDAVLVAGWHYKSAWQAIYGAWRSGIPVLVRGDSHLYTKRSHTKLMVKQAVYRRVIPRFDACLAVGKWSRDYFLQYGASPQKVFTVPHCVDEAIFGGDCDSTKSPRKAWRLQFGLSEAQCVFLFSGKLLANKRPFDFIAALALAHQHGAKIAGVIVGDGTLRPACEALVKQISAPVHFAGFLNQTEIRQAYAGCDVLVLPSEGETWGLVVNEAMTAGRPCIVSDQVGAGPDLIEPGLTGDVFEVGNIPALARLLERYSTNIDVTRSMKAAVKEKIKAYSIQSAVEGTREAVEAACHGLG